VDLIALAEPAGRGAFEAIQQSATTTRPAAGGDEPVDVVVLAIQIEQFGAEAYTP
jgi:hypothetical protein